MTNDNISYRRQFQNFICLPHLDLQHRRVLHGKKENFIVIIDEHSFHTWHDLREALRVSFPPSLPFLFCRWPTWPSRSREKKSLTLFKVAIYLPVITFVYSYLCLKNKNLVLSKFFPLFFWFIFFNFLFYLF